MWMERVTPKKPRVANPGVLAVRVASLAEREVLISLEPKKFFTEPHYAGFPAVLVRLAEVNVADLKVLLAAAWETQAPASLTGRPGKVAKQTKAKKRAGSRRPTKG